MLELLEQNRQQIVNLCRRHNVKRLELFGSAARGDVHASSDVDFLVEFVSYDDPQIADHWFGLQEDLQRLLGREIDLTSLRTAKNPDFVRLANRDKITLYAA